LHWHLASNKLKQNPEGKGDWVEAFIELPEDYNISKTEISTVILNDTIHAEQTTAIGDYDNDSIQDLMVRFNRTDVSQLIMDADVTSGNVTLTITGSLYDSTLFEGTGIIRVRMPGDVNFDGKVDVMDAIQVSNAFGASEGDHNYDPLLDLNQDGKINVLDIILVARRFGQHEP